MLFTVSTLQTPPPDQRVGSDWEARELGLFYYGFVPRCDSGPRSLVSQSLGVGRRGWAEQPPLFFEKESQLGITRNLVRHGMINCVLHFLLELTAAVNLP